MFGSIVVIYFVLDEVETTAESVIVVVEKVAEVTEKVAANIANGLPGDGKVKTAALKIEDIAEQVDKDADKAEAFIRKVFNFDKSRPICGLFLFCNLIKCVICVSCSRHC